MNIFCQLRLIGLFDQYCFLKKIVLFITFFLINTDMIINLKITFVIKSIVKNDLIAIIDK